MKQYRNSLIATTYHNLPFVHRGQQYQECLHNPETQNLTTNAGLVSALLLAKSCIDSVAVAGH